MTDTHPVASHPQEGDLVRYLDRQVGADEERWLDAHLADCEACATRLDALREQSLSLSRLIGSLEATPDQVTRARALAAVRRAQAQRAPTRRWYASPSLRAAAVVALAALATLGVEPVRAWVAERWAALFGNEPAAVEAPATPTPAPAPERGSLVNFALTGSTFILEIRHPQAVGDVTVQLAAVDEVAAQTINAGDEMFVVMPSGLRVENSPSSQASYRLTVPTSVKLIQVFSGGKPVAILDVEGAQLPFERTVPLDPARVGR